MLVSAMLTALAFSLPARGEVVQKGTLRIQLAAAFRPTRLPRNGAGPVAVSIDSRLSTTDNSVPPALKTLRIEVNNHARLNTTGLPECRVSEIQPASTARALSACRDALVGRGTFSIDVILGGGEPYPTTGRLLLFSARYKGKPALLGHIYAAHPFANSFVIPFRIGKLRHGRYGAVLSATLPVAFTTWGHITAIHMRLARRYRYRGARHSFISAGCPAPDGFSLATFPLTRMRFFFADGKKLAETLTSSCRVTGGAG